MSSVVEACGSRRASGSSLKSATSCCMIARSSRSSLLRLRDLEEWHRYIPLVWAWKQTCVPKMVGKQRPQAMCIPQVFGVLTAACLASSHFLHTSSQCEAGQEKEPVKAGNRWAQLPSNPICQFQKEKTHTLQEGSPVHVPVWVSLCSCSTFFVHPFSTNSEAP